MLSLGSPETGNQVQLVDSGGDPRKPCLGAGKGGREGREAVKSVTRVPACTADTQPP